LTEEEQAKKGSDTEKPEICTSPLLCPEEWEKREGEKVLGEYHKDGTIGISTEEADLASFEKFWDSNSEGNLTSEYHKEGAPHLHEPKMASQERMIQAQKVKAEELEKRDEKVGSKPVMEESKTSEITPKDALDKSTIDRPIDLHTIEVISYAVVRALFSQGITLPIKREGVIDMELRVRGKDIIIDTKELFPITVPELVVWRIIYAYKGKPVAELGRGVKKGLKIHSYRGLVMLIDIWRGNRKQRITKKRMERAKLRKEVEEVGQA
jgi:hypothetical protein